MGFAERKGIKMLDRYGRTIDYMRVSITDRCNLRCRYCMPDGISLVPMEQIMTYEEIVLACRAAAQEGVQYLKVTGGEPLVRFGCAALIGMLKRIPGIRQVTMTTNGVLLNQYLPELVENGLDAVNISLDTLKPEVYRQLTGTDALPDVLLGIWKVLETGIQVKINSVLIDGVNHGEWLELAELSKEMPVDVRFIEMMPVGHGRDYHAVDNRVLLEGLKKMYPDLQKDGRRHGNGPAVYYQIPGAKGSVGLISAIHGKFCQGCNRLRMDAKGRVKPCLCFGETVDIMGLLRSPDLSDREGLLREAFLRAAQMKPESHVFEVPGYITEQSQMVQIGG